VAKKKSKSDSHYINGDELRAEIAAAQTTGEVSPRLAEMLLLLATKVYRYNVSIEKHCLIINEDDAIQGIVICLLKVIDRLDISKNVFSYLTTCSRNALKQMARNSLSAEMLIKKAKANLIHEDGSKGGRSNRRRVE
jgi:hypothetical protein